MKPMLARQLRHPINVWAGHLDGAFEVAAELIAAFAGAPAHHRAEVEAFRIPRDERLGEDRDLRPRPRRLRDQMVQLVQRSRAIERRRRRLHYRRPDLHSHRLHQPSSAASKRWARSDSVTGRGDSLVTRACGSVPWTSAGMSDLP